jgi:hypothetical protein
MKEFTQAGEAGLLKRTIASNATYSVPGNASEGVRSAGPQAKNGLFDRRRHVAERCVSRVVELGPRK